MPSLSTQITITKTLPNGRTVSRNVTGEEYINGGWATQGWAAPAGLQKKAEEVFTERTRKDLMEKPMSYLSGLARTFTIAKRLPNGKWVKRTGITGGDFENSGWKQQGWIIPTWNYSSRPARAETSIGKTRLVERIMKQQDWWKPKRSFDQAASYYRPYNTIVMNEFGHNYVEDVRKLQSGKYQLNPQWRTWMDRAQKWAIHNRPKKWRQIQQLSGNDWRINMRDLLYQYNKRRKAPPKVVPIKSYKPKIPYRRRYF